MVVSRWKSEKCVGCDGEAVQERLETDIPVYVILRDESTGDVVLNDVGICVEVCAPGADFAVFQVLTMTYWEDFVGNGVSADAIDKVYRDIGDSGCHDQAVAAIKSFG